MIRARLLVLFALLVGPVALVLVCAHLAGAVWFPMIRRPPVATAAPRRNASGDVELRPSPTPIPTRAIATPGT